VYYDQPRIVRIVGLDDKERDVLVHAGNPDAAQAMQQEQTDNPMLKTLKDGSLYDVGLGRYDVSVSVTPSFPSRRAEAVESMTALIQAFPLAAPYALDVLTKNMDWPGARELAERFKHLVPPEARDDEGKPQVPPEVQQQMQQMQQQLQEATQQVDQLQKAIAGKQTEMAGQARIRQMEIQSNEHLAQIKADLEVAKIAEKAKAEASLQLLEAKLNELSQTAEFLHERRMQLDAPKAETKQAPAPQKKQVYESLNYKDAPPDVRRQIESQAGLTPSKHGDVELQQMVTDAKPKPAPAIAQGKFPLTPGKKPAAAKPKPNLKKG
jgi:hypothetical protein